MMKLAVPFLLFFLLGCGDEPVQAPEPQVKEVNSKMMRQELIFLPKGQRLVSVTFQGSSGIPFAITREKKSNDLTLSPQKYEVFPIVDLDYKYVIQEQD